MNSNKVNINFKNIFNDLSYQLKKFVPWPVLAGYEAVSAF